MSAATMNEMERLRESAKEVIYLIPDSDEGRLVYAWCDDPAPSEHHVRDEAVEYIRKDIHDAHADMLENRGDELQIMLARVTQERDAALEREAALKSAWDKMNSQVSECPFHGCDVATCLQYSGQAPCMSEREQALAAHVEQLSHVVSEANTMGFFTVTYDSGVDHKALCRKVAAFPKSATTTLTKRDLIKQAEAVEKAMTMPWHIDRVMYAKELRQQASQL